MRNCCLPASSNWSPLHHGYHGPVGPPNPVGFSGGCIVVASRLPNFGIVWRRVHIVVRTAYTQCADYMPQQQHSSNSEYCTPTASSLSKWQYSNAPHPTPTPSRATGCRMTTASSAKHCVGCCISYNVTRVGGANSLAGTQWSSRQ